MISSVLRVISRAYNYSENQVTCKHCGKEIKRDSSYTSGWSHVEGKSYGQCGYYDDYRGRPGWAEPKESKFKQMTCPQCGSKSMVIYYREDCVFVSIACNPCGKVIQETGEENIIHKPIKRRIKVHELQT